MFAAFQATMDVRRAEGCSGGTAYYWAAESVVVPPFVDEGNAVLLLRGEPTQSLADSYLSSIQVTVTDPNGVEIPGALSARPSEAAMAFPPQWLRSGLVWRPSTPFQAGITYSVHVVNSDPWGSELTTDVVFDQTVAPIPTPSFLTASFRRVGVASGGQSGCGYNDCPGITLVFSREEKIRPGVQLRALESPLYEVLVRSLDSSSSPIGEPRVWHPYDDSVFPTVPFDADAEQYCVRAWLRTLDGAAEGPAVDLCVSPSCDVLESARESSLKKCVFAPGGDLMPYWCYYHPSVSECVGVTSIAPVTPCGEVNPSETPVIGGTSGASGTGGTAGAAGAGISSAPSLSASPSTSSSSSCSLSRRPSSAYGFGAYLILCTFGFGVARSRTTVTASRATRQGRL